jgi:NAD(P)-dependent dehydrogenase (short-subunit alcohol dehydrogenase family)
MNNIDQRWKDMSINFQDRVVIVTGAGSGLGRQHALSFAARGAKVVVNDFGGNRDGTGGSSEAALAVVEEIRKSGGIAIANGANVTDVLEVKALVEQTVGEFGRVDVLVNNAGILRDKSFSKLELQDFAAVVNVHLQGSVNCTKAVWDIMRKQEYGRIVMTASAAGLYGNFGQANYGAAKAAVIGLMNVLHQEGFKSNIRINTVAPMATTRMTEDLLPPAAKQALVPERVTPAVLFLSSEDAPSKMILSAGGGAFAAAAVMETAPVYIPDTDLSPEYIAQQIGKIADWTTAVRYENADQEIKRFLELVLSAR